MSTKKIRANAVPAPSPKTRKQPKSKTKLAEEEYVIKCVEGRERGNFWGGN